MGSVLQEGGSSPALAVPVVWSWRDRSDGVHRQAGEGSDLPLPGTWNPSQFLW